MTKRKLKHKFCVLIWLMPMKWFLVVILILGCTLSVLASDEDPKGFVESISETVYTWAWPTATYEDVSIKSIDPVANGHDIQVKLSGKSGLSGGDLWLVIIFKLRNGSLQDIRVLDHNALIAEPFSTVKTMGLLIANLAQEFASDTSTQTSNTTSESLEGYRFKVINNCLRPVRVAIKYHNLGGDWRAMGWWNVKGGASQYLAFTDGTYARTNSSAFYYFVETQDGSLHWDEGDHKVIVGGRTLMMSRLEDEEGDTELYLSCPGR